MENNNKNYIEIPFLVLRNKNLSSNSKLLYGIICNSLNTNKECFETNEDLGVKLFCEKRQITRLINQLIKERLITTQFGRFYTSLSIGDYKDKRRIILNK